jgi:hypothetical protein
VHFVSEGLADFARAIAGIGLRATGAQPHNPWVDFSISGPNNTQFATGTISDIRGVPGLGFFRVALTVKLTVESSDASQPSPPQLIDLVADLKMGGIPAGRFAPDLNALPVISYPNRNHRASLQMECDFDRARIEAIETARAGGHLWFDVYMTGRFSTGPMPFVTGNYHLNQGVWVNVLEQMEYQRTLLVEVPVPDPRRQPELTAAVEALARAQQLMRDGQDRDAVGACRDALEEITRALGDDDDLDPVVQRLFDKSRAMTKAERLRVLRRALKLITHPARHRDQVSVGIDWSRIDASAVITMTAAFLNEMSAPGARPGAPVLPEGTTDPQEGARSA